MPRSMLAVVVLGVAVVLAGLTEGYRPGDETCSYATGGTCPVDKLALSKTDGSALIYPGGKTRCAFDDFTDSKFQSNATFFFQVFPKPTRKKLLLFFQGGGACIDDMTCAFSLQCSLPSPSLQVVARAASTGIFNISDERNVFRDWNVVHVPYCTGDLHLGNRVLPARETGLESMFDRPQCVGQNRTTHLVGYENAQAALQWARRNYPDVEELVLGGSSAGSLAAQALAAHVGNLWRVGAANGPRFAVLSDAYVGVLPENRQAGTVMTFYGACDMDLGLPAATVAACRDQTLTVQGLGMTTLQAHPSAEWLFLTSKGDRTQRLFYQLAKDGIFGYPFLSILPVETLYAEMKKMIATYRTVSSRVATFFVEGEAHVFLYGGAYVDVLSDAGQRLGTFLGEWLASGSKPTPTPTSTSTQTPSPTNQSPMPPKPTPTPTSTPTQTPSPTNQSPMPTPTTSQKPTPPTPTTPGPTTPSPSSTTSRPSC